MDAFLQILTHRKEISICAELWLGTKCTHMLESQIVVLKIQKADCKSRSEINPVLEHSNEKFDQSGGSGSLNKWIKLSSTDPIIATVAT